MTNIFNLLFYNKKIKKKTWLINGVETDPTQNDKDDNIDIKDAKIYLTLSQEENDDNIVATIQVNGQEYSFILYDEIINYIKKIGGLKK